MIVGYTETPFTHTDVIIDCNSTQYITIQNTPPQANMQSFITSDQKYQSLKPIKYKSIFLQIKNLQIEGFFLT